MPSMWRRRPALKPAWSIVGFCQSRSMASASHPRGPLRPEPLQQFAREDAELGRIRHMPEQLILDRQPFLLEPLQAKMIGNAVTEFAADLTIEHPVGRDQALDKRVHKYLHRNDFRSRRWLGKGGDLWGQSEPAPSALDAVRHHGASMGSTARGARSARSKLHSVSLRGDERRIACC